MIFLDEFSFYEAERKLIPEIGILLQKRFRILQAIDAAGPIGRRALADVLGLTEREVRKETTLLFEQKLISIKQQGMVCTDTGLQILEQLRDSFYELSGIAQKEKELALRLGIEKVIIIPGDFSEEASRILLGKEGSKLLTQLAKPNSLIAITGGSSVAALGPFLTEMKSLNTASFIAARGSIGEEMNLQANTLVASFAKQCNASYRTLFLPEFSSEEAYVAMKAEPSVQEMIRLYERVNIVVHGIGAAEDMAERRRSSTEEKRLLQEKGAVGEAFGYYFNEQGQIVHQIRTICIQPEHVKNSDHILVIAGGKRKAKAIDAYFKRAVDHTFFITDEAAANEILTL
ncbi:sugar-binding transcriptional regulator [Lysinibacillus sp. 54212]|uniref:sugar-binding transcriptional regulator n=1 Tax=Lysinibacillus sp. 54212 TaxID=3119829 RepID=UPI002FC7CDD3